MRSGLVKNVSKLFWVINNVVFCWGFKSNKSHECKFATVTKSQCKTCVCWKWDRHTGNVYRMLICGYQNVCPSSTQLNIFSNGTPRSMVHQGHSLQASLKQWSWSRLNILCSGRAKSLFSFFGTVWENIRDRCKKKIGPTYSKPHYLIFRCSRGLTNLFSSNGMTRSRSAPRR